MAVAGTALAAHAADLPDAGGVEAIGIFLCVTLADLARRAGQVADDPPSPSYRSQTHLRRREFDLNALMARAYGVQLDPERRPIGTALQERAADMARNSLESAAFLDAMIRAYERALGALEKGDEDYVSIRATEARRFARDAAGALGQLAMTANSFAAAALEDQRVRSAAASPEIVSQLREGLPLDRYLSDEALALAYVSGITIKDLRDLRLERVSDDPWAGVASAAEEVRDASKTLTADLEEWEPIEG